MPFSPIPFRDTLESVYTKASLPAQVGRWANLTAAFTKQYGIAPQKIARAPGRVNIIGEHIDYCGFSVLPAAIERDVLIAFAAAPASAKFPARADGKTTVHLHNLDPLYTPSTLSVDLKGDGSDFLIVKPHHWSNYFISGTKGMLQYLTAHPAKAGGAAAPPAHLFVLVTGSVPSGGGLSSSAAITTASVITILELAGLRDGAEKIGRRAVTNCAIESERLVGVNSGGMDQSASVFSLPLHLLHIEFDPALLATPVALPSTNPAFSFVIANTLVTSEKAITAKFHYNLRVVECRLGARLLAKSLGLAIPAAGQAQLTYKDIENKYFAASKEADGDARKIKELSTLLALAEKALGGAGADAGLDWDAVSAQLKEPRKEIEAEVVGNSDVEPVGGKLKLWTRARHVFNEAARVYQFCALLQSAKAGSTELPAQLGALMNESQASCRDDFECSCPEINEICALARANGALGSRLTGAGWGGSTVSLVPEPLVPGFIKALQEGYYAKRYPKLTPEELADVCFATKPEAGACLFVPTA